MLKNSSREVKRAHFSYILGPPGPTQEMELMGLGGEGPSRSPPPVSPAMDTGFLRRGGRPVMNWYLNGIEWYILNGASPSQGWAPFEMCICTVPLDMNTGLPCHI